MPTLQELKDTWFLSIGQFDEYGLTIRHPDSLISLSTDDNHVVPIAESQTYRAIWYSLLQDAMAAPGSRVFHATWNISNAEIIPSDPNSKAMDALIAVANEWGGQEVYALINARTKFAYNLDDEVGYLAARGVKAILDTNFPAAGTSHQKFFISKLSNVEATALVGCDVAGGFNSDPGVHEVGVMIQGQAVSDLEQSFIERWNSPYNEPAPPISISSGDSNYGVRGSHAVQVLRTYGTPSTGIYGNKPASPMGEFSIWASYLNAIKKAERYIHIEDQYFQAFAWPPCFELGTNEASNNARDTDLVYQLARAVERGVKVVVLTNYFKVSDTLQDWVNHKVANYQREYSINYLLETASGEAAVAAGGEFVVGRLQTTHGHHYIHSKLMLVDDEFSIIGSANFEQRSMTHDNELSVGVVDRNNSFTKELRIMLFQEHLRESSRDSLEDWSQAFTMIKDAINNSQGNVRPFQFGAERTYLHFDKLGSIVAPYAGPVGLRPVVVIPR